MSDVPAPPPNGPVTDVSTEFVCHNERAVLALAFKDQKNLSEVCSKMSDEFFLFAPHRIIFNAMLTLIGQVNKLDLNTLSIRCEELGLSKQIKDQYLPHLTQSEFDDSSLSMHIEAVKNAYLKYKLYVSLINGISKINQNKTVEAKFTAEDLISYVSQEISELDACRGLEDKAVAFSEIAEDLVLERAQEKTDVRGIKTGFSNLDVAINGATVGGLLVVAARMKVGKSAWLANIADYVAYESQQCSVLFLSTEMSDDEDLFRTLAIRTLINERELSNGLAWHDPKKQKLIKAGIKQMKDSPCEVYHEYVPSFTVENVIAKCKYWNRKIDNLGLIIFDYIKMPPARDLTQSEFKEYQMLGELTNALKNQIAGEENLAVITACQLNRSDEVADSDRIERYASNVIHLRRQTREEIDLSGDFKKYGTHMLEIRRTRAGGSGQIPIRFFQSCLKMEEAEKFEIVDEDEENLPQLLSPLDELKNLDAKYKLPNNVSKDALNLSMNDIIKGYGEEDLKKRLQDQIGTSIVKEGGGRDEDVQ